MSFAEDRAKGSPHNGVVLLCLVIEHQFKYDFSDFRYNYFIPLMVSDKLQKEAWRRQDPLKLVIKPVFKCFLSPHLQLGLLVTRCSLRDQVFTYAAQVVHHVADYGLQTVLSFSQINNQLFLMICGREANLSLLIFSSNFFSLQYYVCSINILWGFYFFHITAAP